MKRTSKNTTVIFTLLLAVFGMTQAFAQNNSNGGGAGNEFKGDCELAGGTYTEGQNFKRCEYSNGDSYTCNSDVNQCETCTNGKCTVNRRGTGKLPFRSPGQKMMPGKQTNPMQPVKPSAPASTQLQSNEKPDLVTMAGAVGGTSTTVGQGGVATKTIDAKSALETKDGKCKFRIAFAIKNIGNVDASTAFTHVLKWDNQVIHNDNVPSLAAGQLLSYTKDVWAAPGEHAFWQKVDTANTVAEKYETNNLRSIRFTVKGLCGALKFKAPS